MCCGSSIIKGCWQCSFRLTALNKPSAALSVVHPSACDTCPCHALIVFITRLASGCCWSVFTTLVKLQKLSNMLGLDCRCCSKTKIKSTRLLRTAPQGMARAGAMPYMLLQLPAAAGLALEVSTLPQPHTAPARLHEGQCHSS